MTENPSQAPVLVYMTAGSTEEAKSIAAALLQKNLIACANILPQMISVYHWQNNLMEDQEVVMIAKSVTAHVEDITQQVRALHSYELPCVVAVPITAGNPDFLEWIASETVQSKKTVK